MPSQDPRCCSPHTPPLTAPSETSSAATWQQPSGPVWGTPAVSPGCSGGPCCLPDFGKVPVKTLQARPTVAPGLAQKPLCPSARLPSGAFHPAPPRNLRCPSSRLPLGALHPVPVCLLALGHFPCCPVPVCPLAHAAQRLPAHSPSGALCPAPVYPMALGCPPARTAPRSSALKPLGALRQAPPGTPLILGHMPPLPSLLSAPLCCPGLSCRKRHRPCPPGEESHPRPLVFHF